MKTKYALNIVLINKTSLYDEFKLHLDCQNHTEAFNKNL